MNEEEIYLKKKKQEENRKKIRVMIIFVIITIIGLATIMGAGGISSRLDNLWNLTDDSYLTPTNYSKWRLGLGNRADFNFNETLNVRGRINVSDTVYVKNGTDISLFAYNQTTINNFNYNETTTLSNTSHFINRKLSCTDLTGGPDTDFCTDASGGTGFDSTNVAFLNNTQRFTGRNNFTQEVIIEKNISSGGQVKMSFNDTALIICLGC